METDKKKPGEMYPRVAECEERLNALIQEFTEVSKSMLSGSGSKLYVTDFFFIGVLNRAINVIDAILVLTNQWNFIAAGPLVRVHLDTLLHLSYLRITKDRETFVLKFLQGEQVGKMKDEEGKKLTNARLREYAKSLFPQVDSVYQETSKLIHFSDRHVFTCVQSLDEEGGIAEFFIGKGSLRWKEEDIFALLECVIEVTEAILAIGRGWVQEKAQMDNINA